MPSTTLLIYLHGLNSSAASKKATVLRETLGCGDLVTPTYPAHRPDDAVAMLRGIIAAAIGKRPADTATMLLGSSMGGFYAQYLARRFPVAHVVMINPALRPWELLPNHFGPQVTATGEHYMLTPELVDACRRYAVHDPCGGPPTTLLIDKMDEVIDYRIAVEMYRRCGRIHLFEGGSHAFEHMDQALTIIRQLCTD